MIFGLGAALGWGLADFFGAVAGRRIGSIGTVLTGQFLSLLCVTAILLSSGESLGPLGASIWLLVMNGVATAFAYTTHYRSLELGPLVVVSPIGAAYAVVGVVLAILILGERPSRLSLIGAGIAIVGVVLVSTDLRKFRERIKARPPGLPWAIASAIGFGVAGFLLGWISQRAGWVPGLWGSRVAQVSCYVPVAIAFRRELTQIRPGFGLWVALLAGAADILGVVMYSIGTEHGFVSIVLTASAVFPLLTVALSMAVFRERLVPNQAGGIALVVSGLLLLGLG